ncbi:TPR repeat-containing protein, partial [Corchorus olitorius]
MSFARPWCAMSRFCTPLEQLLHLSALFASFVGTRCTRMALTLNPHDNRNELHQNRGRRALHPAGRDH